MRILIEDRYTINDLHEEFAVVEEILEERVNTAYAAHHACVDKQCKHLYNRFMEELKAIDNLWIGMGIDYLVNRESSSLATLAGIWNALKSVKVQANKMYSDMYFSLEPKPFTNKNYFWNRPRASDYRCSGSTIK